MMLRFFFPARLMRIHFWLFAALFTGLCVPQAAAGVDAPYIEEEQRYPGSNALAYCDPYPCRERWPYEKSVPPCDAYGCGESRAFPRRPLPRRYHDCCDGPAPARYYPRYEDCPDGPPCARAQDPLKCGPICWAKRLRRGYCGHGCIYYRNR